MSDNPEPAWFNGDVDDWDSVEDLPWASCGADPSDPCEPYCECAYCLRKRHRQRLIDVELQEK